MLFLNQLINGVHIGSIYALIALGYTMVYGIVKLINFAHGDIIMVGSYTALMLMTALGAPFWLATIAAMAMCVALGVILIIVLLVKPSGLLGKKTREKV